MKLIYKTTLAAALMSALAVTQSGAANQGVQHQQSVKQPIGQASKFDKEFVREAAQLGQNEVALAQLAEQKASKPETKRLAQELVTSHTQANQQLSQLAFSKNIQIPTERSAAEQAHLNKMQANSAQQFEKEFISQAVKDHKRSISLYEKAAKNATDPDIKAWAQKMIPTLEQHLAMVQRPTAVGEAPRGQSPVQRQQQQKMPQRTAPY